MGEGTQQVTALVVSADEPLDNRLMKGDRYKGRVHILARTAPDPILVGGRFRMDRDRWLVRGMQIPVTIDPAEPGNFEIDWDQVPAIEERAAVGDPTLADPVTTRKRVVDALTEALGPEVGAPTPNPELADAVSLAAQVNDPQAPANFQESLDKAAQAEAPAGKTRAVVQISAIEATLKQDHSGDEHSVTRYHRDSHGKHAAVLSVTVPGSEPYAVYKEKFKHEGGKGFKVGMGLPALVSSSDPSDVEVRWDELLSVRDQDRETAAAAMQDAQARAAQMQQKMAQAPQGNLAAPPTGAQAGVTPEMKQTMIQNAKMALAAVPPNMRQMMIQQYRMAGIEIDDQGNVVE
jgi:hypothetical protein